MQENPRNVYTLNPMSEEALNLIAAIFEQLAEVFPSKYMHVGGDEVILDCWNEDAALVAMKGNLSWTKVPLVCFLSN